MKKKNWGERERENFLCVVKICIEWERVANLYSKMMGIRKAKIKENERAK